MNLDWTKRALRDLENIDAWLRDQADQEVAQSQIERIRMKASGLQDFPRIGAPIAGQTRTALVAKTPYILIYRVLAHSVQILRIRHGREDWRGE